MSSNSTSEIWKEIDNYPGYRVSTLGRVQTKRHKNGLPAPNYRDLTFVPDGHGYPQVRLYRDGDSPRWFFVSVLVLEAFDSPRPFPNAVARHFFNNDPLDNRLVNLRWGTQADNCRDKIRHGTDQSGERHWRAIRLDSDLQAALDSPRLPKRVPEPALASDENREKTQQNDDDKPPFNPLVLGSSPSAFTLS